MSITKIDAIKNIVTGVIGIGVVKIVNGIVGANVPTTSFIDKVTVKTTTYIIGYMLGDALSKYTDAEIDEAAKLWRELKSDGVVVTRI